MHSEPFDTEGYIVLNNISQDEAGLIQAAVLMLAEQTDQRDHARILRRIAIEIDEQLNGK